MEDLLTVRLTIRGKSHEFVVKDLTTKEYEELRGHSLLAAAGSNATEMRRREMDWLDKNPGKTRADIPQAVYDGLDVGDVVDVSVKNAGPLLATAKLIQDHIVDGKPNSWKPDDWTVETMPSHYKNAMLKVFGAIMADGLGE